MKAEKPDEQLRPTEVAQSVQTDAAQHVNAKLRAPTVAVEEMANPANVMLEPAEMEKLQC